MKFTEKYSKAFQYLLPTPLSIAFILTLVTFLCAYLFTNENYQGEEVYLFKLLGYWEEGLWNKSLMVFAMQMMLMLVLGHILAVTPFISKIIKFITKFATSNAKAAALVTFSTILVALFNWGLGLIFGAIISRKIGEKALKEGMSLNYPLIGAAGYSCLMVWHGGISGSSTTKVAEEGHLSNLMQGILTEEKLALLPNSIPFSETVFSGMNIYACFAVLIILPGLMYFLGKRRVSTDLSILKYNSDSVEEQSNEPKGAEHFDTSILTTKTIGLIVLIYICYKISSQANLLQFGFITPNFINLTLFGLAILFHKNILAFLKATDQAIGGASGILIQFPLYFGIMGIMKSSGLVNLMSGFFVEIANETTFPIFTMISAGIVNIFVPSGGGQWAVQGPIIIQAAESLQVPFSKSIMALAYGDQLTNMLQPFWALPLLGITKLKAKDIIPYTLILMLTGSLIYLSALLLF
ncbi:MAG: short-chain fatty acid transporter [Flavobacteriales bacterium]|nr:short-chain fatty acid transporter [Flavobacteriales bacterium]